MKKILMALLVTGTIVSCNQPSGNIIVQKAPIDSLIINWNNSWNNHDSAAVRNLFAADALLIDDNLIAMNANELSAKWISPNINAVNNLKATQLQEWETNERAGYTGKYQFDVLVKDSLIAQPRGVFTVNWKKTDNGDWKIMTATIHSFIEKK